VRLNDGRAQASQDNGEPSQDGGEKVFHSQGSLNAQPAEVSLSPYLVAIARIA
jgi:hypothetical protein